MWTQLITTVGMVAGACTLVVGAVLWIAGDVGEMAPDALNDGEAAVAEALLRGMQI